MFFVKSDSSSTQTFREQKALTKILLLFLNPQLSFDPANKMAALNPFIGSRAMKKVISCLLI